LKRGNGRSGDQRRWIGSIVAAALLTSGFLMLLRIPATPENSVSSTAETQSSVSLKRVIADEAALLDKTPLFLPTARNTAVKEIGLPKSVGVFADFPAKHAFDVGELAPLSPNKNAGDSKLEILDLAPGGPIFLGLGRIKKSEEIRGSSGPRIEVFDAKSGRSFWTAELAAYSFPKAVVWQPFEIMATVDSAGLVGPLVTISPSGSDEVEAVIQKHLTQVLKIGSKLAPGVYRIVLGP